ncbi:uncharacterized protein [Populus alba]
MVVQKHEMRSPGLVARLMGLDSLPAAHRDKHKKVSNSVDCDVTEGKFVNKCHSGSDRDGLNMVKGSEKVESRPQKLQKTGQFERRAVTRFGAEALQMKGVLSRSRKHYHPKLAPPVKSPRISSSKNASRTSRLIDAATRILEPGLQATNRAKSALTYSSSMNYCPRDEVLAEEIGIMLPNIVKQQDIEDCNEGAGKSFTGQTSYKNCGNLFHEVDSRPNLREKQFVCPSTGSNYLSSHESEMTKPRLPTSTPDEERNVIHQRPWDQQSIAVKKQDNTRVPSQTITVIKPLSQEGQSQRQSRSQQCRPQQQESSFITFKQRIQTPNEIFVSRNRTPTRANNLRSKEASSSANAISGSTDFVALNRRIISRGRPRASTLADNSIIDKDRKVCSRRDDSMSQLRSPVRKRRTVSVNAEVESTGFANPMSTRQRNIKSDSASRKEVASSSRSMDSACIKNGSLNGECNKNNCCREDDVESFTFNSPLRHKNFVSLGLKERIHQIDKNASYQRRRLVLDENDGKTSLQNKLPLKGDALSTILEQKLKELASQEEDELISGGSHLKKSTAMILQELIFALTADQPMSPHAHVFNADKTCEKEGKIGRSSVGISLDGDHLSPGSVLEASFSNDSCFSSSLDDSSGCRMLLDSMEYSYDQPQPVVTHADLLDCATSLIPGRTGSRIATDLLNHVSRILQSINLAGGGLTGNQLTHAKEVILNTELLFGNATLCNSDRMKRFLIGSLLLDGHEALAGAMWKNLNCLLGFEDSKDGIQLRRFLLDCEIECLDSKYSRYCYSGFKAWKRVPSCMNVEMLIQEIGEEVRRWSDSAGMILDEIIDWEMSHSLGKWTDFEIEGFETGAEIDRDILQTLVEEIAVDLWEWCRVDSF